MKTILLSMYTTYNTRAPTKLTDGAASAFIHPVTNAVLLDGDEDSSKSDYESNNLGDI